MIKRSSQLGALSATLSIALTCFGNDVVASQPAPAESSEQSRILSIVDTSGQPLTGAMVIRALDDRRQITRFSNVSGQLDLGSFDDEPAEVEVRYPGLQSKTVALRSDNLRVELEVDTAFLRELPSSEWLALLPEGDMKREFTVNCASCHEISHDRIMLNGKPRSKIEWQAAIAMMRAMDAYDVIPPDFDDEHYAAWLAENLSAERIAELQPGTRRNPEALANIEITEFTLPESDSLPHDLVNGPDGRIWITAFFYDELWVLSPEAGEIERISVDDNENVNAQPRALKFDDAGMLWLVNGGSESVLRVDPKTGSYETIGVGMYAHSIDVDAEGDIWVNDYFAEAERVAKVSHQSLATSVFPIPASNRPASEGLPLPYGLQVDSEGRLYSTQMAANTLARFDTKSGKGTLFEMPASNSAPRRPGLDNRQGLWIPEFNTGYVAYFDPTTESFTRTQLGSSAVGLYDIEVNQANNDVWATGSLASTLIRYRPEQGGDILTIPLPTEPAYTRHIAVDESNGDVWTAYSSMPAATPKVVRVRFLEP